MKHQEIISTLSLEQKCALLTGDKSFSSLAIPDAHIPPIEFSDGPHGVRHQQAGANHLGLGSSLPATCFPTAVTLANSWDADLIQDVGQALAEEARTQGVQVLLGPGMCIKRSPLCGRNFEYFSEDPLLSGTLAAHYVAGVQSQGVAACVKHFAANSQETRRQASDSVLDERTLREIYLTAFEIAVKKSHPAALMTSYNLVNGTYANENTHLLKDILRGEWAYTGGVVTDWGGSNDHVAGVAAGSTLEMPACGCDSIIALVKAVRTGRLAESVVDERVSELLDLALKTHTADTATNTHTFDASSHHQLARKAAASGIVLLKNEPPAGLVDGDASAQQPLLPLAAGTSVALIGDFARTPRYQGAGSSLVNSTQVDTLLDLLQHGMNNAATTGTTGTAAPAAATSTAAPAAATSAADASSAATAARIVPLKLQGFEPGFRRDGTPDDKLIAKACELARKADVALVCLGLAEADEAEGADRTSLLLDSAQIQLLHAVAAANPRVVVLLSSGSVVESDWMAYAQAVLYLGLSGQAGAGAALDILTGAINPSGKLAETWPRHLSDTPCANIYPAQEIEARYKEGLYVGYRFYDTVGKNVAFPFGFGLSYTHFTYSELHVSKDGKTARFTLTNTGNIAGQEICQLYIQAPRKDIFAPAHELRAFAKIGLAPHESQTVTLSLTARAYSYFNVLTNAWEIEGGTYTIAVGPNSRDLPLTAQVEMAGTNAPSPYQKELLPSYFTGNIVRVPDSEFESLLGHKLQSQRIKLDRSLCIRDFTHGRSPLCWLAARIIGSWARKTDKNGRPNVNALFIYNMPLRALQKNAGEYVSMSFVDAVVREVKGWGTFGIVPALALCAWLKLSYLLVVPFWLIWIILPFICTFVANRIHNHQFRKRLLKRS
ncbi:MAG: beta-glucosidase [Atopobiaceae bacterium]